MAQCPNPPVATDLHQQISPMFRWCFTVPWKRSFRAQDFPPMFPNCSKVCVGSVTKEGRLKRPAGSSSLPL